MSSDEYADHFASRGNAADYDERVYAHDSHDSFIFELQRPVLRRIVRDRFGDLTPDHHDLACGTGRILSAIEDSVGDAYGYDLSRTMLERAKSRGVRGKLLQMDIANVGDFAPVSDRPVVVTLFRFLLNVPHDVRHQALASVERILSRAPYGIAVIHNHGSARSLRELGRLRNRSDGGWWNSLPPSALEQLISSHGLKVDMSFGFGVLPRTLHSSSAVRPLVRRLDTWALGNRVLEPFAIETLHVVVRDDNSNGIPSVN
jgi:SAM-dependent methyltransferase